MIHLRNLTPEPRDHQQRTLQENDRLSVLAFFFPVHAGNKTMHGARVQCMKKGDFPLLAKLNQVVLAGFAGIAVD